MKPFVITLLILSSLSLCSAQSIYVIKNISPNYYGKLCFEKLHSYGYDGWIAIYDSNTNEEIIKNRFDKLFLNKDKVINSNEIPFDSQEYIYYDDFNFDGIKDFALEDGQHGGYGSDTYKIYLAENTKFVYNEDFSNLTQYGNLGMFEYNYNQQTLKTYSKSGCCLHSESEYIVVDNKPTIISNLYTDNSKQDGFVIVTTEKLKKGKWIKTTKRYKEKDYFKN
ncbi:MAG: hypothetical protein NTY74_13615 [Ignavibacteriae bacterium]|nr:hypothetical protein [Ignavibacteriota bacterium]